ncbi:MAG: serine hydrolase domain-containing protein [Nannocystaceae bacterium]
MLAHGLVLALFAAAPAGPIEGFLDEAMPRSGVPGVAYAVVSGDEVRTGARGVVRLGSETSVTPDTAFLLGSISKSFTALAVMQLVEAGSVDLDAEVCRYLEVFSGSPGSSITVRELLSHTSGYSTLQGNGAHVEPAGEQALARQVEVAATVVPAHVPGSTWQYSNLNYQILGRLIEVVSGQAFHTYVESNILQPIGMTDSFVSDGEAHEAMATGHLPWFGYKRPLPGNDTSRSTAPHGGVVASASDLALYMQVMLSGEDDILSAAGKAAMMRPASEASPFYGLGWFVDPQTGEVWHTGTSPGFETIATMIPADHAGAVVLTNASSGLGFAESTALRVGVTTRALGLDPVDHGSRWSQKALFVALTLAPLAFLLSIAWAWRAREALRAKSGPFGLFSLWFPLLTTGVGAWLMIEQIPNLYGVPLGTLRRFQPDFALVLFASATTGVAWAVFRLAVAYSAPRRA